MPQKSKVAGQTAPERIGRPYLRQDPRSTVQLVEEAVNTHQASTKGLESALQVVVKTTEVQAATLNVIEQQGEQLARSIDAVAKVNQDIKTAQKTASYMSRCFLLRCFTPEPKYKSSDEKKLGALVDISVPKDPKDVPVDHTYDRSNRRQPTQQKFDLGKDYASQQKVVDRETEKQDQLLQLIDQQIDVLKSGALAARTEMSRQDVVLDSLQGQVAKAQDNVKKTTQAVTKQL